MKLVINFFIKLAGKNYHLLLLIFILLIVINFPSLVFGFAIPTHEQIGRKVCYLANFADDPSTAADNQAYKNKISEFKKRYGIDISKTYKDGNSDNCDDSNLFNFPVSPAKWLECGEGAEDGGSVVLGTARFFNHFHNPFWQSTDFIGRSIKTDAQAGGLADSDFIALYGTGISSLSWASDHLENSNVPPSASDSTSSYSWRAAREYFYRSLTESSPSDRDIYVARTFLSLGHIIHLIQDAGQPAHVRNDAHPLDALSGKIILGPFIRDRIETWTEENINIFNYTLQPFDYSKLVDPGDYPTIEDFFDVDPIGAAFDVNKSRGLAEYANHNFVSEDTVSQFSPLAKVAPWHQFKYPEIGKTAHPFNIGFFQSKKIHFLKRIEDPYLGTSVPSPLFVVEEAMQDSASGLEWTEYSMIDGKGIIFKDHVDKLLPKAIQYSAGAIDFFFRGKFDIKITFEGGKIDGGKYFLDIRNRSGEPLGPGKINIFSENSNHERVVVPGYEDYPVNGPIPDGGFIPTITFDLPQGIDAKYGFMLVYDGKLGNEDEGPLFQRGAVIGQKFQLFRVNIEWPDPWGGEPGFGSDQDLYMRGPDGSVISYYNPETDFGQLDFDDVGGNGPENITLKNLSTPGDYTFYVNDYRDHWKELSYDYQDDRCENPQGQPSGCPSEEPIGDGDNYADDEGDLCYCTTRIHNAVRTYHNAFSARRTQKHPVKDIYLRYPNFGNTFFSGGYVFDQKDENRLDDSWWAIQSVCVDDEGNIFITDDDGSDQQTEVHYNPSSKKCE